MSNLKSFYVDSYDVRHLNDCIICFDIDNYNVFIVNVNDVIAFKMDHISKRYVFIDSVEQLKNCLNLNICDCEVL